MLAVEMVIRSFDVVFAPIWEVQRTGAGGQNSLAVEGRGAENAGDFVAELTELLVQGVLVARTVRRIARLHRQLTHPLQRIADLAQRAFGRLRQGDAVVGIACRDVHPLDLRIHPLGNRQTGSVVLGGVDTQT
jgi:hypothetical protein